MQGPRALMAIANSNNKFTMDDCKNNNKKYIRKKKLHGWSEICVMLCAIKSMRTCEVRCSLDLLLLCERFYCLCKFLKLSNLIFKLDSIYSIIHFTLWAGIQNDEVSSYSSFIFCTLPALLCGMFRIVGNNNGRRSISNKVEVAGHLLKLMAHNCQQVDMLQMLWYGRAFAGFDKYIRKFRQRNMLLCDEVRRSNEQDLLSYGRCQRMAMLMTTI